MELDVLFEDNHLIIVNKKPGDIVQGDKTGDKPLSEYVKKYIKDAYGKPGEVFLGVIHRLDRPVSGITIFARTSKALERMNELFREKKIKKTYWAVVKNKPATDEGKLIHFLKKNEVNNTSKAFANEVPGSKRAELDYKLIASSDNYFLLEVNLHTGRHHQIRVQLASMGCPIKGDLKYGDKRSNKDGSIMLHSRRAQFEHPVKEELVQIECKPPASNPLWAAFNVE